MNSTDIFLKAVKNLGLPDCVKTSVYYDDKYTYSFNSSGKDVLKKTESGTSQVFCDSSGYKNAEECMALIQAIVSDNFEQDNAVAIDKNGRTLSFYLQLDESTPDNNDHEFLVNDEELLVEIKKAGIKHDLDFVLNNVEGALDYFEQSVEKNFSGQGWADAVFSNDSIIRFTSKDGKIVITEVEDDEAENENDD